MGLGSVLLTARNSLKASSGQMNIASQNIAGARDPDYTRRSAYTNSGIGGGVHTVVRRDSNQHLLNNYMSRSSQSFAAAAIATGVGRLSSMYSADDFSRSPGKLVADFRDALQGWYNEYKQPAMGDAAIARAGELVEGFKHGSREIERLRGEAEEDIGISVEHINTLLDQFSEVEKSIFEARTTGRDVFIYMDHRDGILKELSEEIGITSVTKADGTMTLYGMDGSTLYDKIPRKVTFEPRAALPAGTGGGTVFIDGVPLGHSSFSDPYGSGNLGGLIRIRDDITPQYQKQLDEMAAALVDMFKGPPALFLDGGDPSVTGLSGRFSVNPEFDVSLGGSAVKLATRDELLKLVDKFNESRSYGAGTGIVVPASILKFAESSTGWLEALRKDVTGVAEYQNVMFMRSRDALSNATGVNTDDELALILQIEQTYSASARIINTVSKMMDDLMSAVR